MMFFFFSISKGKNINLSFLHNFNIIRHLAIQEAVWILKWKFETKARFIFKQVSLLLTTMCLKSLLVIITITIVIIVIIFKTMFTKSCWWSLIMDYHNNTEKIVKNNFWWNLVLLHVIWFFFCSNWYGIIFYVYLIWEM